MFHLQTRVHFKEVEALPARVRARDDELHRARRIIADRTGECDALLTHSLAHLGGDEGRRRFFHDLLVAALDRAFALIQIENVAMLISEDLDFDMARVEDELLDEHTVIAKAVKAFTLGRFKAFAHVLFGIGQAHALPAAARRRLHHHRIADLFRDADGMFGIVNLPDKAGDDVDARRHGEFLGLDLVAHRGNRVHRWADKGDALGLELFGKAGAFGQEAIARMHSFCAGCLARRDDFVRDQIRLGGR